MGHISYPPDWSMKGTAKHLEKELGRFKFNGPGLYHSGSDTMLVIPVDREYTESTYSNFWAQNYKETEVFRVHIFNERSVSDIINAISNAPSRDSKQL